ncbi:MAG: cation:proton antiporter, partial [Alphaproteobacteria bacterium]
MEDIILGVFAVALLLGIASLLVPLAERLRMPHAVLLAALGLGVGFLTVGVASGSGDAGMLAGLGEFHLEAEALLYLFLPALLFSVGINIDIRGLFDEFAAVSMLAVVAVVVCTGVVGLALSQATDLPVVACYLLGAIVATTDPAAVIAVFRDLGAPRRLTLLVQGESLFNDAAAIAMFVIFLDVLLGVKSAGVGGGILDFLGNFTGGIALGYGLGRAVCWLLGRLGDEVVAQITATIVLAYLSFVIGEHYLGISGIVAVAVSSLVVAAHGRVVMGAGGWKTLIEIWHHLEFWCNSLIFVLAALLAGRLLSSVTWHDMTLLAVLIPSALAARAAVLYGLMPGLRALGLMQPVDGRYKAVVLWGGLRGAVTLTLALAVTNDAAISKEVRHFVGVMATGFVLFTLFVGAPTLRPLLRLLGLNRLDRIEQALRDRVMALSQASLGDEARAFAADSGLDPALYDEILGASSASAATAAGGEEEHPLSLDERVQVGLLALAAREKGHYLDRSVGRAASPRLFAWLS